jgi:FKBP-type peptidyl-prolyl cis-trans isomerase SlyD
MEVAANCVVSINFTLQNDKGELLDSSPDEAPLVYLHGADGIIPALEQTLAGKAIGDAFSVTIAPEQAFGPHQEDLVVEVPRGNFPEGQELSPGMQFQAQDPDSSDSRILTITLVSDETVTVDANHPLAGMTLCFEGTVHDVRAATPEEIDHGHPHPA